MNEPDEHKDVDSDVKHDVADSRKTEQCLTDERLAATVTIDLSKQLMTAALAIIALGGAFTNFILDKRVPKLPVFLILFIAFLAFISSIVIGGQGITKLRDSGRKGDWGLNASRKKFSRQAQLCFLGLICFVVAIIIPGQPKVDTDQKQLEKRIEQLEIQLKSADGTDKFLQDQVSSLRKQVDVLKSRSSKDNPIAVRKAKPNKQSS